MDTIVTKNEPYLESQSHPYLARIVARKLQGDSPVSVIHDNMSLWRYDNRVWRPFTEKQVEQAIMDLEHLPVVCGKDEQTQTLKTKPFIVNANIVRSIKTMLYSLRGVAEPNFFEEAPIGLQFNNGFLTIDDHGRLRFDQCSPNHRQRVLMDWDWQPNAQAPRFEQALDQWFEPTSYDDKENKEYDLDQDAKDRVRFLQEFAGACLVGVATRYSKAAILFGKGGNGKSIFIDAVRSVFPKEACSSIEPQTMGQEYRAAQLAGRRINFAADIPAHEIVSSSTFKAVVSGDIITARHIRQDPFEFRPEAGHLFSANELPGTRDHSNGFWRRFVVIEFPNYFDRDKRDSNISKKFQEEKAGIVAWMIQGAARLLRQGGYSVPASSDEICANWRREADVVALWLEECTQPATSTAARTAGQRLWDNFDNWRQRNRYSPMGSRTFYRRLQNLIGKPKKTKASNVYEVELR